MFIYAWNEKSESAKALADQLKIKRVRHENSKLVGKKDKVIINYGSSDLPNEIMKCTVINDPKKVAICTNKLTFFEFVSKDKSPVSIPDWTTDIEVALKWIAEGNSVCARTVLQGHSGKGLVIMDKDPKTHVEAPLYTKYVPKQDEYRVHVVNGEVIDTQRKALRKDAAAGNPNFKIRNLDNGWIYMREGIEVPPDVVNQAISVMKFIGLDFGAVDIIWNNKRQRAYVLEINTAPGLEGTTLENYTNAFNKIKGTKK